MTRVLTIAVLVALAVSGAARAADLDTPYLAPPPPVPYSYGGPYQRALSVPIPPSVLDEGLVVPVPPRPLPPVGGPYLYAPGLNGPYGPPVYPFLPFAFGYGY